MSVLYYKDMNKMTISICMTAGTIIGGFIPTWFGDTNLFDAWSIIGGLIGGIAGIWLGVKLGKMLS